MFSRMLQGTASNGVLCQVGARMHEKLIMTKAKPCDASNDNITHTLPHNKMYVISYHETNHTNGWHMGGCTPV